MKCRLDFYLISQNMTHEVEQCEIISGYRSDHSAITVHLSLSENK